MCNYYFVHQNEETYRYILYYSLKNICSLRKKKNIENFSKETRVK